VWAKLKIA
jgi:hypothetical protein